MGHLTKESLNILDSKISKKDILLVLFGSSQKYNLAKTLSSLSYEIALVNLASSMVGEKFSAKQVLVVEHPINFDVTKFEKWVLDIKIRLEPNVKLVVVRFDDGF
jgi:hypothetical protein